jgi:tRNA nucleotidyltransferase (CCA-adding enzyme)
MSHYQEQVEKVTTPDILWLREQFQARGYDIRIVGGAVRDLLIGLKPNDVDFCTDASQVEQQALYEELAAEFKEFQFIPTGVDHGTYTVIPTRGGEGYEITSLRTESQHDGRHAVVAYTKDWIEDLSRRDLTINAMALTFDGKLVDPFSGLLDLQTKTVRFVGNPEERMTEDYLRILRFFRFLGRFGGEGRAAYTMPGNELYRTVHGLEQISAERIWAEMAKIVAHPSASWVVGFMEYHSVLDILGIPGKTEHFDKLKEQGCTDPVLLMCSLLPPGDVAKAKAMAKRLKWSNEEIEVALEVAKRAEAPLLEALQMHIAFVKQEHQEHERTLSMKVCEFWGNTAMKADLGAWVIPQFPVTGDDLIRLGMKPGKEMGSTMMNLKYAWFSSVQAGYPLTKEQVLVAVQKINT